MLQNRELEGIFGLEYYYGDQIKDKMSGTRSMRWEIRDAYKIVVGKPITT
jgi:hypothetical protein